MKKVYYLKTCSTCIRILRELNVPSDYLMQDIKTEEIAVQQLEQMKDLAGSYEALFSRRAIQYKVRDLKNKSLTEKDYRNLILEEYTFLKRPVLVIDKEIFIGNAAETINRAKQKINE